MRAVAALSLVFAGCSSADWLVDAHVLVDGYNEDNQDCRTGPCPHDENTDLTIFDGGTYLVHRTAISQVLGPNSSPRVCRSDDHGESWQLLSIIPAPVDRDLRDPSFSVIDGKLAIKAITRLPVNSLRDADVDSNSVVSISPDGGNTWGPLQPIAQPHARWRAARRSGRVPARRAHVCGCAQAPARPDNRKRTVLYELAADYYSIEEHGEFPSTGDTAYAGAVLISGDRWLVTYYSTNVNQDEPWARAIFGPTDIWQATIDLGAL